MQASFEHQAAAGSKLPPAVAWEVRKLSSSSSIRRSAAPPAALNTSIISNSIFNPEEVGAQPLVAGAANTSVSSEEGGAVCATAAAAAGPSPDGQSRVGEVLAPEPLLPLYSPSTVDFTAGSALRMKQCSHS